MTLLPSFPTAIHFTRTRLLPYVELRTVVSLSILPASVAQDVAWEGLPIPETRSLTVLEQGTLMRCCLADQYARRAK